MLTIFMAAAIAIAAPQAPGQAAGSVTVRDITYKQLDGTDNAATLVMPASGPRAPRPAILFVHWYEPPKPSSNRAEFLPDALELARDGVVSLLIDTPWSREDWFATRNNGGASGTERAGAARGSAASLSERPEGTGAQRRRRAPGDDYDFSVRYVKELRRALDVLLQQPDIDRTRVAYVGHDFGAMYGALAVAADPRITHFVYMAGTKSFSDWFLLTPKREGADRDAFIAKLAPHPDAVRRQGPVRLGRGREGSGGRRPRPEDSEDVRDGGARAHVSGQARPDRVAEGAAARAVGSDSCPAVPSRPGQSAFFARSSATTTASGSARARTTTNVTCAGR
jgi:hypothetical protein